MSLEFVQLPRAACGRNQMIEARADTDLHAQNQDKRTAKVNDELDVAKPEITTDKHHATDIFQIRLDKFQFLGG